MKQTFGVTLGETHTVAKHGLGDVHVTSEGDTYIYAQADGAVTAYDVYNLVPGTWQIDAPADAAANPADAHNIHACVPQIAFADDEYGWVFVGPGEFIADTDSNGVGGANDIIYVSATAGKLSSTATAAFVPGVHTTAAITGDATGTFYAAERLQVVDAA